MPDTGWPAAAVAPDAQSMAAPARPAGGAADWALLCSALFLQRFSLPIAHSVFELATVPAIFFLSREFVLGRVRIDYDRLLWFLVLMLVITCSLLMNFQDQMLSSYGLFAVMYFLFILCRRSTADRFRHTLRAFQCLATLLAAVAIVQFAAQFVLDGQEVVRFYGVFPEFLFKNSWNTVIPVSSGSSLIKSNGLFLAEPSVLSQIAGLGIIIEALEFRRLRYLIVLSAGLLVSYSGTGLMLVFAFLPFAGTRHRDALMAVLAVIILGIVLLASGTIDASAFFSRIGEFENTQASGFARFVSPFWLTKQNFETASLAQLLLGHGPGTADSFANDVWYTGFAETWFKLLYEYGIIGSTIFVGFLAACMRKTTCSTIVLAALLFSYVFLGGQLLAPQTLIILIVLGTLSRSEIRGRPNLGDGRFRPSLIGGSAAT
jgi:hypothetical protein